MTNHVCLPRLTPNTVRSADGKIHTAPDRTLRPPDDAAVIRQPKAAEVRRRDNAQADYVKNFFQTVLNFLTFRTYPFHSWHQA